MLFNSLEFAVFLPIIFLLYWLIERKNLTLQNLLLVFASYIFYGWWDYRFLSLIFFSTVVDFLVGLGLKKEDDKKKRLLLLWISIIVNLGLLGFFKYYNFFIDNFIDAFSLFGKKIQPNSLNLILPVGISFYTFQTLSYSIDVYKKKLEPTTDFIAFSAFVSFFPQLVAGPIERASHLLPQFYTKRNFNYKKAADGLRQILWGLFKKIVIADNCAEFSNQIFNNSDNHSGSTLALGALFFTFQIYGDFSGYSDIAIGTSRLFGFDLMQNFSFPYFSRNIAEFWRRWHISLSTWFRDYVYIPLGGSKGGTLSKIRNTFIIFLVSGFWHGPNWTYIVWGLLNAIYFLPLLLSNNNRNYLNTIGENKIFPSFKEFASMITTFMLTMVSWIFFRAENINHALSYIKNMFSETLFKEPEIYPTYLIWFLVVFICVEWFGRQDHFALEKIGLKWKRPYRWAIYFAIITSLFLTSGKEQEFIYFQF